MADFVLVPRNLHILTIVILVIVILVVFFVLIRLRRHDKHVQDYSETMMYYSRYSTETPKKPIVRYVKSGATGLKGTKNHPYGSLAQAQADPDWQMLVILPSNGVLDGGISLRDGQFLTGEGYYSRISNSSSSSNNGDAIVCSGKNEITQINIVYAQRVGINISNSSDVLIQDVTITNTNLGKFFVDSELSYGAIDSLFSTQPGKTMINRCDISVGTTGINLTSSACTNRKNVVNQTRINDMQAIAVGGGPLIGRASGIEVLSMGTSSQSTTVTNCEIFDLRGGATPDGPTQSKGVAVRTFNSGTAPSTTIEGNLFDGIQDTGIEFLVQTLAYASATALKEERLKIKENRLTNVTQSQSIIIQVALSTNYNLKATVKGNYVTNSPAFCILQQGGDNLNGSVQIKIENNDVSAVPFLGFVFADVSGLPISPANNSNLQVQFTKNRLAGVSLPFAAGISQGGAFGKVDFQITENCFQRCGASFLPFPLLVLMDFGAGVTFGSQSCQVHHNNFIDVDDSSSCDLLANDNWTMDVADNFWSSNPRPGLGRAPIDCGAGANITGTHRFKHHGPLCCGVFSAQNYKVKMQLDATVFQAYLQRTNKTQFIQCLR